MKYKYYLMVLGVVVTWGLNVIAIKVLVEHFQPVTMTAFRIFTAAIVVFLILWFSKSFSWIHRKDLKVIIYASFFNILGHHFFLSYGLTQTSASNSGIILGLVPLFTAVLSVKLLNKKLTWQRITGILSALTGVIFIVLNGAKIGSLSIGDLFVFLSVVSQAYGFILIKKASNTLDSGVLTAWMMLFGAVFLLVVSWFWEPKGLASLNQGDLWLWLIFLGSALFATGVGHMFYNRAIQHLGPVETSVFLNFNPFFALIGAYFFLGESLTLLQIGGFLFIVLGVLLGSGIFEHMKKSNEKKEPLPPVHQKQTP